MVLGTLYYLPKSARGNWFPSFAKYLGLEIESKPAGESPEFAEKFPLKKCPAFITSDNLVITETIAIIYYFIEKSGKLNKFCGETPYERASTMKWLSMINSDFINTGVAAFFRKEEGKRPEFDGLLEYINESLDKSKYLTGDKFFVCDIFACNVFEAFGDLGLSFDKYPNIVRFISAVKENEYFKQ